MLPTLKEVIFSCDKDLIIEAIIDKYYRNNIEEDSSFLKKLFPFYYYIKNKIKSKHKIKKAISNYTKFLKNIENITPNPNTDKWVIIPYRFKDEIEDNWTNCISIYQLEDIGRMNRIKELDNITNINEISIDDAIKIIDSVSLPQRYGYMTDHWKNILGFYIDTHSGGKITLYEIVATAIYEMTFFGYTEEDVDNHLKKMYEEYKQEEEKRKKYPEHIVTVKNVEEMMNYCEENNIDAENSNIVFNIENKEHIDFDEIKRKYAKCSLLSTIEEYVAILNCAIREGLI